MVMIFDHHDFYMDLCGTVSCVVLGSTMGPGGQTEKKYDKKASLTFSSVIYLYLNVLCYDQPKM